MRPDRRTAKFRKRKFDWNDPVQVAAYQKKYLEGYNRKTAKKRTPLNKLEYWKRYRQEHKEEVAAYQKAYRSKHKKYLQARQNMWNRLHPQLINRINREYRLKNPDKPKAWRLKSLYGLTPAQVAALGAHCHICGREFTKSGRTRRAIDHCHATGIVRGVLCASCNHGLGSFDDSPDRLRSAENYLRRSKEKAS